MDGLSLVHELLERSADLCGDAFALEHDSPNSRSS